MRYGSVCSGIESASVAWEPLGWQAVWFAEIEPFPSRVLAHHWSEVPNMGDMCKLPDYIRSGLIEAPDLLVGGTPCQAFSVAGSRKGMEDPRGQLSIKFVEVANAIDEQRVGNECVVLWENVPGVLSDKENAFGCFLGEMVGEDCSLQPPGGKWSNCGVVYGPQRTAAWRILDAQYFGVAQRRRRLFVVASSRKGFNPSAILFESEGLRRDIAPSREKREDLTGPITAGIAKGMRGSEGVDSNWMVPVWPAEIACTINAHFGDKWGLEDQHALNGASLFVMSEAPIVTCSDISPTVTNGPTERRTGNERVEADALVAYSMITANTNVNGLGVSEQLAPTLDRAQPCAIAFHHDAQVDQMNFSTETTASQTCSQHAAVATTMSVRRLTPTECERLQGFPDGHTAIPGAADGPRYKSIGNSKAVPVVRWLGRRIERYLL